MKDAGALQRPGPLAYAIYGGRAEDVVVGIERASRRCSASHHATGPLSTAARVTITVLERRLINETSIPPTRRPARAWLECAPRTTASDSLATLRIVSVVSSLLSSRIAGFAV